MRRLALKCTRCKRQWEEHGFHVNHESEKLRTCPWDSLTDKARRCDGKLEIRLLGEKKAA